MTRTIRRAAIAITLLALFPLSAHADDAPAPTAAGTFVAPAVPNTTDETDLRLQGGGAFASGNTQSIAVNAGGRFVLRRNNDQFTAEGALNYGTGWVVAMGAAPSSARTQVTTAENYLGRLRYDRFFWTENAVFVTFQAYRDVPSGYYSRISGQIGYARSIIDIPTLRRFWVEGGYDLTYENLVEPPPPMMPLPSKEVVLHSARGFIGFEDHTSPLLDIVLGLEALLPVNETDAWRINGSAAIGSHISTHFSIALSFVFHYVHEPVPGYFPLDTITLVSLIYQLTTHHPPPVVPSPPPECMPAPSSSPVPVSSAPASAPPSGSPEPASSAPPESGAP